jgi:hypothetical protein
LITKEVVEHFRFFRSHELCHRWSKLGGWDGY